MLRNRRVTLQRVPHLSDAREINKDRFVVLIDLENTVVPYGAATAKASTIVLLERLTLDFELGRFIFVTNSSDAELVDLVGQVTGCNVISRAHKPFTSRRRIAAAAAASADPGLVLGDQILTDGILAWRLGCPFIQYQLERTGEPAWPRIMRAAGNLLAPLFFKEYLMDA